jgi:hypothetical protein
MILKETISTAPFLSRTYLSAEPEIFLRFLPDAATRTVMPAHIGLSDKSAACSILT